MIKEIARKAAFVIVLLATGFSLEFLFYRKNSFIPDRNPREKRILLVGGSIIESLAPGLKSMLVNQRLKNIDIRSLTYPALSSDLAVKLLQEHIQSIRPDSVLLLLGMHEIDPESTPASVLRKDLREKFLEFAVRKNKEGLSKLVITTLREMLRIPGNIGEIAQLDDFLRTLAFRELMLPEILEPAFIEILNTELSNKNPDRERIIRIFRTAETVLFVPSSMNRNTFKDFLSSFESFLLGNRQILTKENNFIGVDNLWMAYVTKEARGEDLVNYLIANPDLLFPFNIRLYVLTHQLLGRKPSDPRTFVLLKKLKEQFDELGVNGNSLNGKENRFRKNILVIKEILQKNNVNLVLLQYPNTSWKMISDTAQYAGIKSVENRNAFSEVLTGNNYFLYFLVKNADTGHMTQLGAETFSKEIYKQAPELFH